MQLTQLRIANINKKQRYTTFKNPWVRPVEGEYCNFFKLYIIGLNANCVIFKTYQLERI